MSLRAVSLRAQLLAAFVIVIVGTTAGLTYDAYRTNLAKLEAEARQDAAAAANSHAHALHRMLTNRQRRADGVLAGARALCGETSTSGRVGWAPDCMQPMLNAFRAAESATGAVITYDNKVVVASGTEVPDALLGRDSLARITWISGRPSYVMRAAKDGLVMRVQYGNGEVASIFRDVWGLGGRGEAFLIDANGRFVTAARYVGGGGPARGPVVTPPGAHDVEPVAACRTGPGEMLGIDYRGIRTLHAYQPVPALEGACVDAHVNWDEVLQPAEDLRDRLLTRGLLFILAGALYSLVASHGIAAPVRRLARAARGLRARLDEPIPVDGPSEVQALGVALREASADLAALLGREQAARREAQAANRAKDRFLAAVTHELRTPLTAILGWTHIVRAQKPRDTAFDRGLDAIERNAQTQHRLIEDLLDVSRIVTGRLRVDRQIVPLAAVLDRALDAIRPQADEKQISVQTLIENPMLAVAGDPVRLEQVVLNLIANAVKFSRRGGMVFVAVTRVGANAELSVRDEGEGIVKDALPHVFDWFWQGESPPGRASSGLGLGLGIVRQLAESHGGSVRAESDGPGLGSRFVVTLPLVAEPALGLETLAADAQRQIM